MMTDNNNKEEFPSINEQGKNLAKVTFEVVRMLLKYIHPGMKQS